MNADTLATTSFETICDAFDVAFGDYAVSFSPSASFLGEMTRRRGVRFDLSVGVREGDRLVAFTLNGLGRWQGELTAYDCGTGVIPAYRGRRLTSLMLAKTVELLRAEGATQYLLEVIQANEKAIRAYRGAGFGTSRELRCWQLEELSRPASSTIAIEDNAPFDAATMASMRDCEPSWQNDDESIARAGDPHVTFTVRDDMGVAATAVLFPMTNDLAQLAVAPRARRRGFGTALLAAARERCDKPLRILNVDARDDGTNAFLAAAGATEIVRQFEMLKRLV